MKYLFAIVLAVMVCATQPADAAGFQQAVARDDDGGRIELSIWYPSKEMAAEQEMGPFRQTVADGGPVRPGRHALIVVSHGTGGASMTHFDTAIALANAGFIVVAIQHPFDNYRDSSNSFMARNFADRPRHVTRVIDFMVKDWAGSDKVDSTKIGILGHSAGGATALISTGARADFGRLAAFCRTHEDDWGCRNARDRGAPSADTPIAAVRDQRIRAAVLMAPAIGEVFTREGLANVKIPVQLWVGEKDEIVRDAAAFRGKLPVPPRYHLVANGGHFSFLAPCGPGPAKAAAEICADPKGFDRPRFLRRFQRSVIAFFRDTLV